MRKIVVTLAILLMCLGANHAYALSQNEAINWVYAQEGEYLDWDGYPASNPYQCVDLIKYYYDIFGVADYAMGNGCDYIDNALPPGWTRIQNYAEFVPEPGDIAVWTDAGWKNGHVAIILDADVHNFTSMDQNWPQGTQVTQVYHTYNYFWGVIRPSYTNHVPYGYLDYAEGGLGTIRIYGWAKDDDTPNEAVELHMYVGGPAGSGAPCYTGIMAGNYRDDVGAHGYDTIIHVNETGTQQVYVYAINRGEGNHNPLLTYCPKEVTIQADSEAPKVTGGDLVVNPSTLTSRFSIKATDNVGVDHVDIHTWYGSYTSAGDTVYKAIRSGDTWYYDVPNDLSNGKVRVMDARVFDAAGNQALTSGNTQIGAKLKYVQVTFNAADGTCSETSRNVVYAMLWISGQGTTYHTTYGFLKSLPIPVRTGYAFDGWYTSDGKKVTDTTQVSNDVNHTLTAHWTPNQYTVSFDANGGTGAPDSQSKTHDEDLMLSETVPDWAFHTFQGWTDGETIYQPGDVFSKNADTVLTAVWQFKVTNYTNGKAVISQESGRILVTCNQACVVIINRDGAYTSVNPQFVADGAYCFDIGDAEEVNVALKGDVNVSGTLNNRDITAIINNQNNKPYSSLEACLSDIDNNGIINEADVRLVARAHSSDRSLKWAEENKNQFTDYTNGKAVIMLCADEVLVKCASACTVLVKNGDEYTRIDAQEYLDDIHLFTVGENAEVVVTLKADVDLNGIINGNDYVEIVHPASLGDLQIAVADLNEDGVVDAIDKSLIRRTMLSPADPAYYQLSWGKDSPVYANTLILPQALTSIESEAFNGVTAVNIVLPDGVESIADDAFGSYILLVGPRGGYAENYASLHSLPYLYADEFAAE